MVLATRLDWLLADGAPRRGISPGKVAAATLVLGGVLGGLGLWAGRFVRKGEVEARKQCYFTEVVVGARLGASFGGGRVAVVDYSREDPEEEG